jgi:ubiquinone/menaquinone biosynthesis C-methylase UbiE
LQTKEIIAGYWDLRSGSYGRGVVAHMDEEREIWKRYLAQFLAEGKVSRALDVGAGTGFLSLILDEMGANVTGLDLSRGMLSYAKKSCLKQNKKLELCLGDAESLPIQSSSFDLVTSRHLLWTLPDPARAVAEWMRVLRPGGKIIAIDGNWFDPAPSKRASRWVSSHLARVTGNRNPIPFSRFYEPIETQLPFYKASRPDQCQNLFRAAGLKVVSVDLLKDINHFYRKNAGLSYRLANSDAVFLVKGEKTRP